MDAQTILKTRYLLANFFGLAMIASVFVYAVVVEVVSRYYAPFTGIGALTPEQFRLVKYVFVALALGHFLLIKFLQKFLSSGSIQRLFTGAIVTLALCEAVALFGLMLFFLAGNSLDFYLFMFLSLCYFWLFFPKYQDWEKLPEQPSAQGKNVSGK